MSMKNLPIGKNAPQEVNVFIENPMGGAPVKYELDKESGFLFVDRFLHTPMYYPGNYGFIPHTLSEDGDPVDVLVIGLLPVTPGAVLPSRPVGVLLMEDEKGKDEKIIAVPTTKMFPYHDQIKDYQDIQPIIRDQIEHFFTRYKDLEKGKWVKVTGWSGITDAQRLIIEGMARAKADTQAA